MVEASTNHVRVRISFSPKKTTFQGARKRRTIKREIASKN